MGVILPWVVLSCSSALLLLLVCDSLLVLSPGVFRTGVVRPPAPHVPPTFSPCSQPEAVVLLSAVLIVESRESREPAKRDVPVARRTALPVQERTLEIALVMHVEWDTLDTWRRVRFANLYCSLGDQGVLGSGSVSSAVEHPHNEWLRRHKARHAVLRLGCSVVLAPNSDDPSLHGAEASLFWAPPAPLSYCTWVSRLPHADPRRAATHPNGQRPYLAAVLGPLHGKPPLLAAWLAYHREVGVQHVYAYVAEGMLDAAALYLLEGEQTAGRLTTVHWPQLSGLQSVSEHGRLSALEDSRFRFRGQAEWVVCMDTDDFLTWERPSPFPQFVLVRHQRGNRNLVSLEISRRQAHADCSAVAAAIAAQDTGSPPYSMHATRAPMGGDESRLPVRSAHRFSELPSDIVLGSHRAYWPFVQTGQFWNFGIALLLVVTAWLGVKIWGHLMSTSSPIHSSAPWSPQRGHWRPLGHSHRQSWQPLCLVALMLLLAFAWPLYLLFLLPVSESVPASSLVIVNFHSSAGHPCGIAP